MIFSPIDVLLVINALKRRAFDSRSNPEGESTSDQVWFYESDFDDPAVRLADIDGDGVTDLIRADGATITIAFNTRDPETAWSKTLVSSAAIGTGYVVDFRRPEWRLADMTGDGMQDAGVHHLPPSNRPMPPMSCTA